VAARRRGARAADRSRSIVLKDAAGAREVPIAGATPTSAPRCAMPSWS
jgi:hypothetical protein